MKRYTQWCCVTHEHALAPHEAGDWVAFTEANAEIERLRSLLVQWQGNCTGRHGSQNPCGLTADQEVPPVASVEPGCTRSHPHELMNAECEQLTRLARIGAGIPPDGAPSMLFAQQMKPDTAPLTHQQIFSVVHHHAAEIVRLTATVPVERLAGCMNWKPKHGVGPYCGNCGFHENEHADLHR